MTTDATTARAEAVATSPTLENALHLQLWLAASLLGLPDSALAGLGLSKAGLEAELAPHQTDVDNYRKLRLTSRLMTRAQTAELLRCRVNTMALAARTPAEMAAIARTVRTLPDWVWEDAIVEADRPRSTGGPFRAGHPLGRIESEITHPDGSHFVSYSGGPAMPSQASAAAPAQPSFVAQPAAVAQPMQPLNREQRRRLDAMLRKGK